MNQFIQRFGDKITGSLSGFDRIVVSGHLRRICYPVGMYDFLERNNVKLKDFKEYALKATNRLINRTLEIALQQKRPVEFLASGKIDKEAVAREIASKDKISEGLICVFKTQETSSSYDIAWSKATDKRTLVARNRKCLHLYHYLIHPEFGFMNARIQTWFPFRIQLCLNGREWLSRKLDQANLRYHRRDNCVLWVEDFQQAQQMLDQQVRVRLERSLSAIARMLHPDHRDLFRNYPLEYYWSLPQTEWATDLIFDSHESLQKIYRPLTLHAINLFSSRDVMRFLGRQLRPSYKGEVISDYKERREGLRIKHWAGINSIKAYDKFGIALRVEVTLNQPRDLRTYRPGRMTQAKSRCALICGEAFAISDIEPISVKQPTNVTSTHWLQWTLRPLFPSF